MIVYRVFHAELGSTRWVPGGHLHHHQAWQCQGEGGEDHEIARIATEIGMCDVLRSIEFVNRKFSFLFVNKTGK